MTLSETTMNDGGIHLPPGSDVHKNDEALVPTNSVEETARGALVAFRDIVFSGWAISGNISKGSPEEQQFCAADPPATTGGEQPRPPQEDAETRRFNLADSMNAIRRQIETQVPPRADRREIEGSVLIRAETPLRTDDAIRTENRKINEAVTELEKRLVRDIFDPVKSDAIVKELEGHLKRLDILIYNLPDGASDADIRAAKDAEVKRYAKEYGISQDLPIDELYGKVNREFRVRALRSEFEKDCKKYGLDPEKSNYGDLRFRWDCDKYKLDPKTATREEALAARAADHREYWAKYYGLNPGTATQADVDRARDRSVFEMDCMHARIDPRTTTPERFRAQQEQRETESRESWCKTYGLDPKTTTKAQFEEVHNFHVDCHLYKLDQKTATREQLAAKKLDTDCKTYGLDPKTATVRDVERMRDLQEHRRLCMRYQLDARATTPENLHEVRCEAFGVPKSTTKDRLLDIEDRWDSRGY